jgi:hypothetical protein
MTDKKTPPREFLATRSQTTHASGGRYHWCIREIIDDEIPRKPSSPWLVKEILILVEKSTYSELLKDRDALAAELAKWKDLCHSYRHNHDNALHRQFLDDKFYELELTTNKEEKCSTHTS